MPRQRPASPGRVTRATLPDAEARLALLELMLASDSPAACAERALEWLGEHAGVAQSACLLVDEKPELPNQAETSDININLVAELVDPYSVFLRDPR